MNWNWYCWNSLEDFDTWHELVKQSIGLPRLSLDKNGNEREPLVTEYTKATEVESKWIAMVSDEFKDGLTQTELRNPMPPIEYLEA